MSYCDTRRTIQIATIEFKSEVVCIAEDLKPLKVADQSYTEMLCERADSYTPRGVIEVKQILNEFNNS